MDRVRINIAIIEPSDVVFEGLSTLLMKSGNHFHVARLDDLNELCTVIMKRNLHIVIMNPVCILNRISEFAKIRNNHPGIMWIGLIYSYFENEVLARFNDTFSVSDPLEILEKMINSQLDHSHPKRGQQEQLSERERDVLIRLVKGLSNKEIAEELSISIHTVGSHRKNIMEKTGIKSLSGLTIYAISMKIIPLDTSYI
jgi:DNA-binding CsgD family transcriptional regulator